MPQTAKIIAIGNISEEAEAWLLAHECKIEESLGLKIILLSIEAGVSSGQYNQEYCISFYGEEGEYEPQYCSVYLDIDASDTKIILKK